MVKNPLAMQETQVRSLGQEDLLEEGMATHNSMDRGAWWAIVHGVAKSWTRLTLSLGEGDGTPLQYSCLENPMDGGAW